MKSKQTNYQNVLSTKKMKQSAKALLVATVVASQVFTVLPTNIFAAEASGVTETTNVPSAESVASEIPPVSVPLALEEGTTENRAVARTFDEFKRYAESGTVNVIELGSDFQFLTDVTVNSNMRIEGQDHKLSFAGKRMIMKSTSIIDIQDVELTSTAIAMFQAASGAAPTLNIINNVAVNGFIMGGTGKLAMSIDGSNNSFISPANKAIEVDELEIKDGARVNTLQAKQTAINVRSNGTARIGANTYLDMTSDSSYAFDAASSSLVVGKNAVIKSKSKFGTLRATTIVIENGADLDLASGPNGYGIYATGNITIGDDVKLKATGTGTAVHAFNNGSSIIMGKNADIDITSDNGYGFFSNGKITFSDNTSFKLKTQSHAIYATGGGGTEFGNKSTIDITSENGVGIFSNGKITFKDATSLNLKTQSFGIQAASTGGVEFGSISNQPKAEGDKVKIDINSTNAYGIYSSGPVSFGDDTDVAIKSYNSSIYAAGASRVNFGAYTDANLNSSVGRGVWSGGTVIGDNANINIDSDDSGIENIVAAGEGLTTGKNVALKINTATNYGIYTVKNIDLGEANTVDITSLSGYAIFARSGSAVNMSPNSTMNLRAKMGVYQDGGVASAFNAGTGSTVKINASQDGINTTGSTTFSSSTKVNIQAATGGLNHSAINAHGVITFNKDSMVYAETLSNASTSVFNITGVPSSKLVLNSPKYIDFRQQNLKTGHIVKGYGNPAASLQSRVEINNVPKLYTWLGEGVSWSATPNNEFNNIEVGRIPLISSGAYGGTPSGIEGFSLENYSRISTVTESTIARPTLDAVYTTTKTLAGTGVPGNEIVLTLPGDKIVRTTVGTDGKWSIAVPAGTVLATGQSITAYQTNGVIDSLTATTKIAEDLQAPAAPTVDKAKAGDTTLTGKGEPNAEITVTLPDNTKVTGKVEADGTFKITVPALTADSELKVTQTGANGKPSDPTVVKVASNEKPVITATDKTINVGDTFNPLTGVTATDKEDGDLTSSIQVVKNTVETTKVGTYAVEYSVTDSDKNTTTKTITVTVAQADLVQTTINALTTDSVSVSGKAEPNAAIVVKAGSTTIATGTVGSDGNYSLTIPKQAVDTVVTATATKNGKTSNASTTVTQEAAEKSVKDLFKDGDVTGDIKDTTDQAAIDKAQKDVDAVTDATKKAELQKNLDEAQKQLDARQAAEEEKARQEAAEKSVKDLFNNDDVTGTIKDATDQAAIDKAQKVVDAVTDPTKKAELQKNLDEAQKQLNDRNAVLDAPTIDKYTYLDSYVTGKVSAGTATVSLYVNGVRVKRATPDALGNYKFDAYGLGLNTGVTFEVRPVDAKGKEGKIATATVAGKDDLSNLLKANDAGISTATITGTVGSGIDSVRLSIDGVIVKVGQITNGTYSIATNGLIKEGSKVEVVGFSGKVEVARVKVNIINDEKPVLNPLTVDDDAITGHVTAGSATSFRVSIGGVAVKTGTIAADGTFQSSIGKQALGTEVTIEIKDASGYNALRVSTVKVTESAVAKLDAPTLVSMDGNYIIGTAVKGTETVVIYEDGVAKRTISAAQMTTNPDGSLSFRSYVAPGTTNVQATAKNSDKRMNSELSAKFEI